MNILGLNIRLNSPIVVKKLGRKCANCGVYGARSVRERPDHLCWPCSERLSAPASGLRR